MVSGLPKEQDNPENVLIHGFLEHFRFHSKVFDAADNLIHDIVTLDRGRFYVEFNTIATKNLIVSLLPPIDNGGWDLQLRFDNARGKERRVTAKLFNRQVSPNAR